MSFLVTWQTYVMHSLQQKETQYDINILVFVLHCDAGSVIVGLGTQLPCWWWRQESRSLWSHWSSLYSHQESGLSRTWSQESNESKPSKLIKNSRLVFVVGCLLYLWLNCNHWFLPLRRKINRRKVDDYFFLFRWNIWDRGVISTWNLGPAASTTSAPPGSSTSGALTNAPASTRRESWGSSINYSYRPYPYSYSVNELSWT